MLLIKNRVVSVRSLVCLVIFFSLSAKESEEWPKAVVQPKEGNFSLPVSQQPPTLFSFGQNLVDEGDFITWIYPVQLKGKQKSSVELIPSFLYGLTTELSLFIELPVAVKVKNGNQTFRDFDDMLIQLEQVVYVNETVGRVNDISVVGNMTLPTGPASQGPAIELGPPTLESSIGFGSPTFFLGVTLSSTHLDWYYFASFGGQITTFHKNKQKKFGNSFFYQGGIGKNIAYKPDKWIFNWLVEFNGVYNQRDIVNNKIDCNSGGNTIIIGPSLFFSTQKLLAQAGIAAVVTQHLFGEQLRDDYVAAAYVGWKF